VTMTVIMTVTVTVTVTMTVMVMSIAVNGIRALRQTSQVFRDSTHLCYLW
jgi:hypothetical protein